MKAVEPNFHHGDFDWTLCVSGTLLPNLASKVSELRRVQDLPRLNVPLLRALWSLLDGSWGVLEGSWGVLVGSN